jgi:hypothetical protein
LAELPWAAADSCPCVGKLRTVLPVTVGIRDGAVQLVSIDCDRTWPGAVTRIGITAFFSLRMSMGGSAPPPPPPPPPVCAHARARGSEGGTAGDNAGVKTVGDTVGEAARETQWERRCEAQWERHSRKDGEGDTVGEAMRETQWERHSGRDGEGDTVGHSVG